MRLPRFFEDQYRQLSLSWACTISAIALSRTFYWRSLQHLQSSTLKCSSYLEPYYLEFFVVVNYFFGPCKRWNYFEKIQLIATNYSIYVCMTSNFIVWSNALVLAYLLAFFKQLNSIMLKRKLNAQTLNKKSLALKTIKNEMSNKDAPVKYSVPKGTILTWVKKKKKYLMTFEISSS